MITLNTSLLFCLVMMMTATSAAQQAQDATTSDSDITFEETVTIDPDSDDAFEQAVQNDGQETEPSESTEGTSIARPRAKRLPPVTVTSWAVGLTSLQWNENMTVSQLGVTTSSNMNFNGIGLQLQKEIHYMRWGWSAGALLAAGRANAGPFSNDLKVERQNFSMLAITPRLFWRLTNKVNVGGTAMIYMRNIDLPSGNGVEAAAGEKYNVAVLADMNLRIFKAWDFYQAIGPIDEGAYLWKIGVNYRY
ncbi:hypothetical protein B9G69_010970 [Bdellovibrio sp. SKB1291214]|uniref:hypothetical protein n=1 Tax=Bdellovibrio sp. SKB1291214 TaxID=1732569 RepID=UPI000B51E178|nr:hypothetical protein [Bdellovibrio sp. SKB1291214]UYL07566.1 hypothetical protein B9G69_010970 [Bdellovibrio sp. SKB1291214]